MTKRAKLIDISKYQVSLEPKGNLDGIIIRAGYGLMKDPLFTILTEAAQPVPVRGAYHYFSSNVPWETQAKLFLKQIEGKGFHFYALDFEKGYNNKSAGFASGARKWIDYVAEKTGKKVLLYTNPSTYNEWLKPYGNWMRDYPLWVAQWPYFPKPDTGQPRLPKGHPTWTIWQYSGDGNHKGAEYGVKSRDVDMNVFNGTIEEFYSWAGIELEDTEPIEPEPIEPPEDTEPIPPQPPQPPPEIPSTPPPPPNLPKPRNIFEIIWAIIQHIINALRK